MNGDGTSKGITFIAVLIAVVLGIIVGLILAPDSDGAVKTNIDRCPNQPEVLKTTAGAHKRAQKGWDSQKLKKNHSTIERVRIQSRCAPTKEGRRFVNWQIRLARAEYKKAKKKALVKKLYDNITSAPGQARLAVLRQCESTNRYNDPSAPAGAYGMLQGWALSGDYFASDDRAKKWQKLTGDGPTSPPYTASKHEQDIRASLLYQHHGTSPWECPF